MEKTFPDQEELVPLRLSTKAELERLGKGRDTRNVSPALSPFATGCFYLLSPRSIS